MCVCFTLFICAHRFMPVLIMQFSAFTGRLMNSYSRHGMVDNISQYFQPLSTNCPKSYLYGDLDVLLSSDAAKK